MEGKRVRSAVVFLFMLGFFIGQCQANFKDCYKSCFIVCVARPPHNPFKCATRCLKSCFLTPLDAQSNPQHYFCNLGCATSLCSNISTIENPSNYSLSLSTWIDIDDYSLLTHLCPFFCSFSGGEKVDACVNSCDGACFSSYAPTKN